MNGTIEVDYDQLTLSGGGSSSNATLLVDGILDLTGGNNATYWAGEINGSGSGSVLLSSGTIIGDSLLLNCAGSLFQWAGGIFSGAVSNAGVVNISGPNPSMLANRAAFYNTNSVRQTGTGGLGLDGYGGGTTAFYNLPGAIYNLLSDSPIYLANCCGTVFFQNQGLFLKGGGSSNAVVSVNFNNQGGTIQLANSVGTLTLAGGGVSSNGTSR